MTGKTPPTYKGVAERARSWWSDLQRYTADEERNPTADTAALARLRRCAGPAEAMGEAATLDLFRRLGLSNARDLPRVAVIAMVLAHIRTDKTRDEKTQDETTGRTLSAIQSVGRSKPDAPDSARMTPLRFRRLLACRDDGDLVGEMRRFVALAGKAVNVGDLAASLFFWGERVRARWAFDYYGAGYAAPGAETTETTGSAA